MRPNNINTTPTSSRVKKLFIWCAGILLTMIIGLLLVQAMLASGGERIQSLHDFATSPWLFVFRLILYGTLWYFWAWILSQFMPNADAEIAQLTRRPLVILLVAYELFFASNVLNFLM